MKAEIIEFGPYAKQTDGSVRLVNHANSLEINGPTIVGFTYKVSSKTTQKITAHNTFINAQGQVKTSEHTIETNALFGCIQAYNAFSEAMNGEVIFKVSFPDYPELNPLEQRFYCHEKRGILFGEKAYQPTTAEAIKQFETTNNVQLCEDYSQFLRTHNGLYLNWWQYASEIDNQKGAYESDKYGFMQTHYPFYEDLSKLTGEWDWLYEIKHLFGFGNANPYADLNTLNMQHLFYHKALVTYAYPIGVDGGGNIAVQIAQGKDRGKLAMLDHEVANAMVDWVEGKTEDVYEIPPSEATADGFLADCYAYGGLTLFDTNFTDFFTELMSKHKELYNTLIKKYGK